MTLEQSTISPAWQEPDSDGVDAESARVSKHLDHLGLPEQGKRYVLEAISSPPSRKVGTHRNRNLIADVPIPHLGVVLQAESGSGEYFFLIEMSRKKDVMGIYDQPTQIPIPITNASGIRTRTTYTPDFLVIHSEKICLYEIKSDKELLTNCRRRPNDWRCCDGHYAYLPVQQHFASIGIQHVVIPNSAMSAIKADNLNLLASVRMLDDTPRLRRLRTKVKAIFKSISVIRIGQILDALDIEDATAIFQLIDEEFLHVDLNNCFLASPKNIWISDKPSLATLFDDRGFRFKDQIEACASVSTSEVANPKYLIEIASRFAACGLISYVDGLKRKAERTVSRYKWELKKNNNDPTVLIPKWALCGNRGSRLEVAQLDLMHKVIASVKGDPNHSSIATGWREFQRHTARLQLKHVGRCASERTFYNHYHRHKSDSDLARQRGGRRASNAAADAIDPLRRVLCPTRPFAIAHIDHYEFDLALFVGETPGGTLITERAWVTAMVDAYSGEVLALWVSFRKPCAESCAMVARDCVWRHGKLPELLVVDGGPEFDSIHFTVMLATLNVVRVERPPEDPRFGKEVERLFGAFKECFARGLPGFVPGINYSRKISGKLSASKRAQLELCELIDLLEIYTFQGYNNEPKPGFVESRSRLRAKSEAMMPFVGRQVALDTRFLVLTATPAPASCYQLAAGRGVRVYGHWYSCRALLSYAGAKKYVQVRVEPFDGAVVYVCIERTWYVCRSSNASIHRALSEAEVIERTSSHQQLRHLRRSLTLEAQQKSYELKMDAYQAMLSAKSTTSESAQLERGEAQRSQRRKGPGRRRFENIGDLVMDGEV